MVKGIVLSSSSCWLVWDNARSGRGGSERRLLSAGVNIAWVFDLGFVRDLACAPKPKSFEHLDEEGGVSFHFCLGVEHGGCVVGESEHA